MERAIQPTREPADALFREQVEAARAMTVEQRIVAGMNLFELACRVTADGIRHQFPEADDAEVSRMLAERLALARRLEERP